jgi:hypothetical protein
MSIPRRSSRIAHLTYASEKRQAAMATKKSKKDAAAATATAAAAAAPAPAAHIKHINITSYWRDKLYDEIAVEDWYFTMRITMSDGTKRTSTFWNNYVRCSNTVIAFGCGDHIGIHDGVVCLIHHNCFSGSTTYTPFAPHITFAQVKSAFLPLLVDWVDGYKRFDFECPADKYPWEFETPTYELAF